MSKHFITFLFYVSFCCFVANGNKDAHSIFTEDHAGHPEDIKKGNIPVLIESHNLNHGQHNPIIRTPHYDPLDLGGVKAKLLEAEDKIAGVPGAPKLKGLSKEFTHALSTSADSKKALLLTATDSFREAKGRTHQILKELGLQEFLEKVIINLVPVIIQLLSNEVCMSHVDQGFNAIIKAIPIHD